VGAATPGVSKSRSPPQEGRAEPQRRRALTSSAVVQGHADRRHRSGTPRPPLRRGDRQRHPDLSAPLRLCARITTLPPPPPSRRADRRLHPGQVAQSRRALTSSAVVGDAQTSAAWGFRDLGRVFVAIPKQMPARTRRPRRLPRGDDASDTATSTPPPKGMTLRTRRPRRLPQGDDASDTASSTPAPWGGRRRRRQGPGRDPQRQEGRRWPHRRAALVVLGPAAAVYGACSSTLTRLRRCMKKLFTKPLRLGKSRVTLGKKVL
jgi:hypothetical protein